jgi:tetratricopeptide (TPR) repeat protein
MALVICKGCGKQVSTTALACPRCQTPPSQTSAAPASAGPRNQNMEINWIRPAALGVCLIVAAVAGGYAFIRIRNALTDWRIHRLVNSRKYDKADQVINDKLRNDRNNPELWILAGENALATGDLARAQDAFSRASSLDRSLGPKIGADYLASGREMFSSDSQDAERRLDLAADYDPSLAPKIGQLFFDKGKVAFELHDMNTAEALFQKAAGFDSTIRANVAQLFADAILPALNDNLSYAERYAKDAVGYDPATAQKEAESLFQTLAHGLCDLHSLGKARFMALMKLSNDLGLSDATKAGIPYRFAYAMQLYENGPRVQGIGILQDIAQTSPKSCEGIEANYVLSPPSPGRIMVTPAKAVTIAVPNSDDPATARLLYVDFFSDSIRLTFSLRAPDDNSTSFIFVNPTAPKLNKTNFANDVDYILDDNGALLKTTDGFSRFHRAGRWRNSGFPFKELSLAPGQEVQVTADFPMVTPGACKLKFVSPEIDIPWQPSFPAWETLEVEIKRDLFD